MWKRLREAIGRVGRGAWQRTNRVRALLSVTAAKRERDQENSRRGAARARFWAGVDEGRREAEAHKESGA
jgi:hypothetical protein